MRSTVKVSPSPLTPPLPLPQPLPQSVSYTFMGTCSEACRGYNPITAKMGIAKSLDSLSAAQCVGKARRASPFRRAGEECTRGLFPIEN